MEVEEISDSKNSMDDEVSLPGFRFHPTDEELVGFYLRRKVEKKSISIELIKQTDIYKHDPWDLPKVTSVGEKEWYFFCRRARKYRNSVRPNRVTGSGFWKATGIDKHVYSTTGDTNDCIGLKKSLVYYIGSAGKGTKTDWMMHEFRLPSAKPTNLLNPKTNTHLEAEVWTLCRIFKRNNASVRKYVCRWPADTSSKTCSISDSDHNTDNKNCERWLNSATTENGDKRPHVCEYDHNLYQKIELFSRGGQLVLETPQLLPFPPVSFVSSANSNTTSTTCDQFIGGENWDELRPIVDRLW